MILRTYARALTKRPGKTPLESLSAVNPVTISTVLGADQAERLALLYEVADSEYAPPVLLHNAVFPATLEVLTAPALPTGAMGLVHESSRWALVTPVTLGSELEITARLSGFIVDDDGAARVLITAVVMCDEQVSYVEEAAYVAAKTELPAVSLVDDVVGSLDVRVNLPAVPDLRGDLGVNAKGSLEIGGTAATAVLELPGSAGRSWARLSGDINPIHMSGLTAKAFGFAKAIIHGAALEGWAQVRLGVDGSQPYSGATRFRAPVLLPASLELVQLGDGNIAIVEQKSGRDLAHLVLAPTTRIGARYAESISAQVPPTRIVLPRINGKVSSTAVSRGMVEAAVAGNPEAVAVVAGVENWRKGYREAFVALTGVDDPARGADAPRAGLAFLDDQQTADGTRVGDVRPREVPASDSEHNTGTGKPVGELIIPFQGTHLRGESLRIQVAKCHKANLMTDATRDALFDLIADPSLFDLTDQKIAILGAGAELSPARFLLSNGATVLAVARPSSKRLGELYVDAGRTAGKLILSPRAASDVVDDPGAVAGWLRSYEPDAVVETIYTPGADLIRAQLGADVVERLVAEDRDVLTAWWGSPADAYVLHDSTGDTTDAIEALKQGMPARFIGGLFDRFSKDSPAIQAGVFNGLMDLQGPSYAAAKRIGRWRATVRAAEGKRVSYNVAPWSQTASVLQNRTLRAAYRGLDRMGFTTFPADTTAAIMGALMVWDLRKGTTGSAPGEPGADLLVTKAIHGALWTQDKEPQALMTRAVLLGGDAMMRGVRL